MHCMDLKSFFFPPRCLMWLTWNTPKCIYWLYAIWEMLIMQHDNYSFGQQDLLLVFDRWCINITSQYCLLTSTSINVAVMWLEIMCLSNDAAAGANDLFALHIAVAQSMYIISNESFKTCVTLTKLLTGTDCLCLCPWKIAHLGRLISSRKSGRK